MSTRKGLIFVIRHLANRKIFIGHIVKICIPCQYSEFRYSGYICCICMCNCIRFLAASSFEKNFSEITLCPIFLGWLDTLFWYQKCDWRWAQGCCNNCLPFSHHENRYHQVIWDSELYWNSPQRAVPAGKRYAWVCKKEEAHQTGTVT